MPFLLPNQQRQSNNNNNDRLTAFDPGQPVKQQRQSTEGIHTLKRKNYKTFIYVCCTAGFEI